MSDEEKKGWLEALKDRDVYSRILWMAVGGLFIISFIQSYHIADHREALIQVMESMRYLDRALGYPSVK